jgi:hypothetical protein
MLLSDRLRELIDAAFTGLWVQTYEPDEAIKEIQALAAAENWQVVVKEPDPELDPVAVVRALLSLESEKATLLVLPNFTPYLGDPVVKQSVYRAIQRGKTARNFILILSAEVKIPVELEKVLVVVEHELPTRADLEKIGRQIGTEPGEYPEDAGEQARLLDAAAGLTRYEAEGAFSLAIVRNRKLDPGAIWELKSGMLKKSGLLQLHRGGERFADLGGLEALKTYCLRALEPGRPVVPKGVMLVGVPGSGKSCYARALGNETGRPCLTLDVGSLMGSLVGQTEQAIRSALRIADAMAPCVLFIDEVEKALAGQGSDLSGVTTRLFGTLLTWLADHRTPVYTIGTSNDLSKLPSAFTRAGRFNSTWFFDYPDQEQRAKIWPLYLAMYGLDAEQPKPDDDRWTGAEIRQCCEEAALQGIPILEAAQYVIPVAVSGAAENEAMRQQAAGKYLDACRGGTFSLSAQRPAEQRRAIKRAVPGDPSRN